MCVCDNAWISIKFISVINFDRIKTASWQNKILEIWAATSVDMCPNPAMQFCFHSWCIHIKWEREHNSAA